MDLLARLRRFASADQSVRRAELLALLCEMNAPFIHYRDKVGKYWPENIVVSFRREGQPHYVLGAHYDSVPGSTGANDNGAAVCILLEMIEAFLSVPPAISLDIVFFDLEEIGVAGGNLAYIEHVGIPNIFGMINLDICGVGDTILAALGIDAQSGVLQDALAATVQSGKYAIQLADRMPQGDDRIFEGRGIPTITACIIPAEDIEPLAILVHAMEDIGKPPDPMPSILQTFHGGSRDSIDFIEEQAMTKMLAWTRDLVMQLQ
ncbi:MAG: M28 family peptidase [Chloroflexota bacterium]